MQKPSKVMAITLTMLSLAGCAGVPVDWGRSEVAASTAARGRTLPAGPAESLTADLLARPLTPDAAVTLAFANNPAVRLQSARLGLASAAVYDAARLGNPSLGASRLSSSDADARPQIGLGLAFRFTELLFLSSRKQSALAEQNSVRLEVADAVMQLAATVEAAWYRTAAAEQALALHAVMARTAQASATLAQRFADAGNLAARGLALEQANASESAIEAEAARAEVIAERSALNLLMGLPAERNGWTLAKGLPAPPDEEPTLPGLQATALQSRLDVAAAAAQARATASATGLARRTRWLGPVEIGVAYERETDGSRLLGPTLALELPLFNWGQGRAARAQALLDTAEAELDARVLAVSNGVGAAHAALLSARARVDRYRDTLIPQRERVLAEMQREHDYMLIGVFELLAARQQTQVAYGAYLDAVRDYWLARVALARAVGRALPVRSAPRTELPTMLDGPGPASTSQVPPRSAAPGEPP